jgi:hypothetical protein
MADNFWKVRKGISFYGMTAPTNPADGDVYFDTIQGFLGFENGSWGPLGGSGTINYNTNPSIGSTNGYNLYNNGAVSQPTTGTGGAVTNLTFTSTQTSPLVGHTMGVLSKAAANAQGEGLSYDFTSDLAFSPGVINISFEYQASANFVLGTNSDIQMWVYDITNAVLIPVTPNYFVNGVATPGSFSGYFQTNFNSTNYRLIWHITTTNALAWTFNIANVSISPNSMAGANGSPIVKSRVEFSSTMPGSGSPIIYDTVVQDNFNAYNPSTGTWTCPAGGDYIIAMGSSVAQTPGHSANQYIGIYVNGVQVSASSFFQSTVIGSGTTIQTQDAFCYIRTTLKSGDTVQGIWNGTASVPTYLGTVGNYLDIVQIASPSTTFGLNIPVKSNSTGSPGFSTAVTTAPGAQITDPSSNPIQCVITTQGQAVRIGFEPDGVTEGSMIQVYRNSGIVAYGIIDIYRDGVQICSQQAGQQNNIGVGITGFSPASFYFTDNPPAGTHTYTAFAYYSSSSAPTAPSGVNVIGCQLVATMVAGISSSAVPASLVSRIVKSNSTGASFVIPNSPTPITDGVNPLSATVICNGGDVEVGLQDDGSGNIGTIIAYHTGAVNTWPQINILFYRDGTLISTQAFMSGNNTGFERGGSSPAAFRFIDTPPVGTHTYTVQVYEANQDGGAPGTGFVEWTLLFARPLA